MGERPQRLPPDSLHNWTSTKQPAQFPSPRKLNPTVRQGNSSNKLSTQHEVSQDMVVSRKAIFYAVVAAAVSFASVRAVDCNIMHSVCFTGCHFRCKDPGGRCADNCMDKCDCRAFACMCEKTKDSYYCDELKC
jgi:hypothetical protein